jgi:hypothetical protein
LAGIGEVFARNVPGLENFIPLSRFIREGAEEYAPAEISKAVKGWDDYLRARVLESAVESGDPSNLARLWPALGGSEHISSRALADLKAKAKAFEGASRSPGGFGLGTALGLAGLGAGAGALAMGKMQDKQDERIPRLVSAARGAPMLRYQPVAMLPSGDAYEY